MIINDWDYRPEPIFCYMAQGGVIHSKTNTPKIIFEGVELEIDGMRDAESLAYDLGNISGSELFYLKHDGSLNYGFEVVSHPCSLDFHLNKFPWKEICDTAISHGGRSHDAGTCGLHVHVNNSYLGNSYVGVHLSRFKLLALFDKFWSEITTLSRRRYLGYCEKNGTARTMSDIEVEKDKGRRFAINMCNGNTTEIRIWRGTLKLSTLLATLEITARLCEFVKTHNLPQCRAITWDELKKFLTHKTKYVAKYISERSL